MICAVNFGGFVQITGNVGNEISQYEDGKDLSRRCADENQRRQGIQQVQVSEQPEQRHKIGDERHHHQDENGVPEEIGEVNSTYTSEF